MCKRTLYIEQSRLAGNRDFRREGPINLANVSGLKNPERDRAHPARKNEGTKERRERKKGREKTYLSRQIHAVSDASIISAFCSLSLSFSPPHPCARSPRFKHSADASGPLLSAIRYVHERTGKRASERANRYYCRLHTLAPPPFLSDIRFPNISLLLPALRGSLYGIPRRCIRYVQKCLASA